MIKDLNKQIQKLQFAQNKKIEQKWGCMTHDFNWHVKWSVTQQKYRWPKKSFSRKFYEFQVSDHANIGGIYLSFMRNWQMKCASLVDYMNTCKVICMPKWYKKCCIFPSKHQVENRNWPDVPMSVLKILAKFMPMMFDCFIGQKQECWLVVGKVDRWGVWWKCFETLR